MSRRKKREKRFLAMDPVYDSVVIAKLINQVMKRGKKNVARKIVHHTLEIIKEKTKKDPLEVFEAAMKNVTPLIEIKPRRIGGATYQVPTEVTGDRGTTLAMRWLLGAARSKKGKPMEIKLADELMLAAKNEGSAIKKKEDTHRMAEANRAFAHFAW